jgi:hypothetical protein
MLDYSNAVIYKIVCKDPEVKETYVGSTRDLNDRIKKHKNHYKNRNYKVYKFIREHGGWDNWEVEVVQDYACSGRDELKILEDHYIKEMGTLNDKSAATFDKKEYFLKYRENNRDEIKEYGKNYREQNKGKERERKKIYYLKKKAQKESSSTLIKAQSS